MPYPFDLKPVSYAHIIHLVRSAAYEVVAELTVNAWVTTEPVRFSQRLTGSHIELKIGMAWASQLFDCAWMSFTGAVPTRAAGAQVVALVDYNGEGYVADELGSPVLGITNLSSSFDRIHGFPGKKVIPLFQASTGLEHVDFWVDAANNDLFGNIHNGGALQQAHLAILHPQLLALSYDLDVLVELQGEVQEKSARSQRLRAKLYDATRLLFQYTEEEAAAARALLAPELAKRGGDPSLTFSAIGHAHMDLAWLWPIRETKRKCARTFSTVLAMMERYPEYLFGASQPQQYAWVKEEYPELYAGIQQKVSEGRWEIQGAMWVEPDTNIPGGESLVRQIIYGKRFFREEFGIEPENLWEPDVFGYTGALPQILMKSGIKYFMTQKLSWNEINKFPHQTFWWEGIDGSRVLAHMLPEENYNGSMTPRSLRFAENNYKDSPVADRALMLFGIGDGGGGPGEEHLERLARVKNIEGLCPVEPEFADEFFHRLEAQADKYVTWRGELYLEKHQGTLTSQARNKRFNRKIEYLLREVELSAVWATQADTGCVYPSDTLDRIWREVLLYQFHDILPGSSITRVYDESLARYSAIEQELAGLLSLMDQAWAAQSQVVVNSVSWPRAEWLKIGSKWQRVSVPALGRLVLDSTAAADCENDFSAAYGCATVLENDLLRVAFTHDGSIESVYDKKAGREVLAAGETANTLNLYDDDENSDAWDFRIDYMQRPPARAQLVSTETHCDGPRTVRSDVYQIGNASTLKQQVSLTVGSKRIDFATQVDWQESNKMLRTSFPVNINATHATCDIQFGTIRRPTTNNTSWDSAVQEIAAHKWVDLSEHAYGVALLNDCKYGHQVKGKTLNLNLLRSPQTPGVDADRAEHEFTYALLPHTGDAVAAQIMRSGYELNIPLRPVSGSKTLASHIPADPWLAIDAAGIVLETVKKSEDGTAIIVRLYESTGSLTTAQLTFGFDFQSAHMTDLMEHNPIPLERAGRKIDVSFGPFEIQTIRIVP